MRQELMQFDDWGNGIRMMNTQTGNDTWFVLFAQMKKIKKDLKKEYKSDALGRLFGVLLFATEEDTWLADNEVGVNSNSIKGIQTTIMPSPGNFSDV